MAGIRGAKSRKKKREWEEKQKAMEATMSEPKYSVLLTDEQVNDLALIQFVRQGKAKKANGNGYIIYNEKWHNEHLDTELRGCGRWLNLLGGYKCSVCGHYEEWERNFCPECGARME